MVCKDCLRYERSVHNENDEKIYTEHIKEASRCRNIYNTSRKYIGRNVSVLSFDFKSLFYLPHNRRVDQSFSFTKKFVYNFFGVVNENNTHHNKFYLTSNQLNCSKVDMICSYLSDYCKELFEKGITKIIFFADNCISQNKNRYLINFLYFIMQKYNFKSISLNFMTVGHTHNSCDRFFGIIQNKLVQHEFESPIDICKILGHEFQVSCLENIIRYKDLLNDCPEFRGIGSYNSFTFCLNSDQIICHRKMIDPLLNCSKADEYYTPYVEFDLMIRNENDRFLSAEICPIPPSTIRDYSKTVLSYVKKVENLKFYLEFLQVGLKMFYLEKSEQKIATQNNRRKEIEEFIQSAEIGGIDEIDRMVAFEQEIDDTNINKTMNENEIEKIVCESEFLKVIAHRIIATRMFVSFRFVSRQLHQEGD